MCEFARALIASQAAPPRVGLVAYELHAPVRCLCCEEREPAFGFVCCEGCRTRPNAEATACYRESLKHRPPEVRCVRPRNTGPNVAAPVAPPQPRKEDRPRQLALIAA